MPLSLAIQALDTFKLIEGMLIGRASTTVAFPVRLYPNHYISPLFLEMQPAILSRVPVKRTSHLFRRGSSAVIFPFLGAAGKFHRILRAYSSLAKSLACLSDESSPSDKERRPARMELKRLIEVRIKRRVKAQFSNGKFHDLMEKVIANADTLRDSYDIIKLNSNVDMLSNEQGDLCFISLAKELSSGSLDVKGNTVSFQAKTGRRESLVLPRVKLKVIQEAIRIALEVVYRPHFSKISHGCRSGRGHQSALRYVCKEIQNPTWWFTLNMNKEVDSNILNKLIATMEDKIKDGCLFSFIRLMFDARVLNLVFGRFPKGNGLPQEGILSPILTNIYLDMFDREVFRLRMRYEGLGIDSTGNKDSKCSDLRQWIRRQMKANNGNDIEKPNDCADLRIHVCRYIDEIFISVLGSEDTALCVKSDVINYLRSLYLDVEDRMDRLTRTDDPRGLQFLGTVVRVAEKEHELVRAVHKLKDKVRLFAFQKQEIWDAGTARIGKKWLGYGLRRIKESEIKQLGLSTPILDHISQFRKEGMKTDHWFKSLLKIWMQDVNAESEEALLCKYIAEPSLPPDLRDSFYDFQKQAKEYVTSETAAITALLPFSGSSPDVGTMVTRIEVPFNFLKRSLYYHGLINIRGFPRHVSSLVLQDNSLIVSWFSGLVHRWLRWYSEFDNFKEIKPAILECARMSCVRTLAAKHRIHESIIQKRFELELMAVPTAEELENGTTSLPSNPDIDEALMYGMSYSGTCTLLLSRVKVPSRTFTCFITCCLVPSPSMYILRVKDRQRFPGWKTGFSASIHPSLNGRRIGLCNQHVEDLYLGHISLQSVEFGALSS